MQIAGTVDLYGVLRRLSELRPVFHSEADFQLALAWQVQLADPALRVRMETRPAVGMHLDLAVEHPDTGQTTAVELKYLTRLWVGTTDGDQFDLKNQGAQDIRAYDVVKDITRVESFVASSPGQRRGRCSHQRPRLLADSQSDGYFKFKRGHFSARRRNRSRRIAPVGTPNRRGNAQGPRVSPSRPRAIPTPLDGLFEASRNRPGLRAPPARCSNCSGALNRLP
jgi:hypothetical protein